MVDYIYARSMIIFVSVLFGLDISLGMGGYKTHELWCSGDTFSAEMIVFTNILCLLWEVTEAEHIISITVHIFVLIQWTSQKVSQLPRTHLVAADLLNHLENFVPNFVSMRPQTHKAQTDLESKSESCCLNSD